MIDRIARGLLVAACLAASAGGAGADVVHQSQPFDMSIPLVRGGTGTAQPLVFDTFDPGLGTLREVRIGVSGTLVVQGTLPGSFLDVPPGDIQPVPYFYQIPIALGLPRLGLERTPEVRYAGIVSSIEPVPIESVTTYARDVVLDAASDAAGVAPVSTTVTPGAPLAAGGVSPVPPVASRASRDAFASPAPGTTTAFVAQPGLDCTTRFAIAAPSTPFSASIRTFGSYELDYVYDVAAAPAVPAPPTAALLAAPVAAVAATGASASSVQHRRERCRSPARTRA